MSTPSHTEATVETKELEAGRELDAEVVDRYFEPRPEAVKTYRELEREDRARTGGGYSTWRVESPKRFWKIDVDWGVVDCEKLHDEVPEWEANIEPSIDMSDAWEVVEKMKAQGFDGQVFASPAMNYYSRFENVQGRVGEAYGKTPSHAICIAALNATDRAKDEG